MRSPNQPNQSPTAQRGQSSALRIGIVLRVADLKRSAKSIMKIRRRFSVFGSRFLYLALVPWLLVCIPLFPYMAVNFGSGIGSVLLSAMVSAICFVGLLAATDGWRFIRLTIALLALLPLTYMSYFCHTLFVDGMSFTPSLRISQASPFSAFLGLLVWGVPSIFGVRSLSRKARRIRAVEERLRLRKAIAA